MVYCLEGGLQTTPCLIAPPSPQGQVPLLGSQHPLLPSFKPLAPRPVIFHGQHQAQESLGLQLGSQCSACTFLFLQARTEFLRKKARHQNSLPALEAAVAGAAGSSGAVDLFRELLVEGKGVTRGNREYEEEKRQEKVSWSHPLPQIVGGAGGGGAPCPQV